MKTIMHSSRFAFTALALLTTFAASSARAATFNMLSCCPGEDNAREARFVWLSDSASCLLFCVKASDPANVHTILPYSKAKKPVAFSDNGATYYKYSAKISDLKPGTEYMYWVEAGSDKSPQQKFKTAGTGCNYNFMWAGDVHASHEAKSQFVMDTLELMRQDAERETASSGGIDFVLFSGDAVGYGSRYDNWQKWNGAPTVTNYMFAAVPGDMEYCNSSGVQTSSKWYLAVKNNPTNGPANQAGCYWFLRDSVMFVGIDSPSGDGNEILESQTNWFDNVVTSQRGKFRYLVVFQHDPWFVYDTAKTDSADKSRGNYDVWRPVFDKHKVDLALSGDEHNYVRSKPLRGDAEDNDGTVYMVTGEIASTNYSATIETGVGKYFAAVSTSGTSCGASWIEVRPGSLKLTQYWDKYQSPNYTVYDSVTITPKSRGWVYEEIGTRAHKRYRFSVDAPRSDDNCMQISEIQLLNSGGNRISSGFNVAYDSTTTTTDGDMYPSGEEPNKAADGNTNTKWLDWRAGLKRSAEVRSAVWLDFCFDTATKIYGYRWYTGNDDTSNPGRTPVSWTLSAYDDDDDTWYIIDRVVGYDSPTANKTLAYPGSGTSADPEAPAEPEEPIVTSARGTYYALSVGVNNYQNNRQGKLNGCVPDAKNVLSACTNSAHGLWLENNCQYKGDSSANKSDVRAALNAFADKAKSGDTVLYYHSSHGGDDCICLYDAEYYATDLAIDLMRFETGVRVIVVLDTCHSGSMFKKDGSGSSSSSGPWNFAANVEAYMSEMRSGSQAKGAKTAASGPYVGWVTACDDDQTSLDVGTGGWFTNPFVAAWKSNSTDANGDGYNDIKEIFNIAAPQAIDPDRAPQTYNESVLRSVAVWAKNGRIPDYDYCWTGYGGNGDFSNPNNWTNSKLPVSGATLDFGYMPTNATLNADIPGAVFSTALFGSCIVTVNGTLNLAALTNATSLAVGENGTLTVSEGVVNGSAANFIYGNAGHINVTGTFTFDTTSGDKCIVGAVTVADGATLSVSGSSSGSVNGTLTLAGGSTVSFNGLNNGVVPLTVGGLSVGSGTKPVISVDASGLADGAYNIIASSSATAATGDSFTLSASGVSGKIALLEKSGNNIRLVVTSRCEWTGGAGDGDVSNPANWSLGVVPSAGNTSAVPVDLSKATSLTGDMTMADGATLVLPEAGTGLVSIDGDFAAANGDGETVNVQLGDGNEPVATGCYVLMEAKSITGVKNLSLVNSLGSAKSADGYEFAVYGGEGNYRLALFVRMDPPAEWVNEAKGTQELTGTWTFPVEYDENGWADVAANSISNSFTALQSSTGRVVTVEMKVNFESANEEAGSSDLSGVKAGLRLGNGAFQLYTCTNGVPAWIAVEADGIMPVGNAEYDVKLVLDETNRTYSAAVSNTTLGAYVQLRSGGSADFAFAAIGESPAVRGFDFMGDGFVKSILGTLTDAAPQFQTGDEIALSGAVTLTSAEAEWLNASGPYATIYGAVSSFTQERFETAYLCNLAVTNEKASAVLKFTGARMSGGNLVVDITLERIGAVQENGDDAPINGTLKIYGATEIGGEANTPITAVRLSNATFGGGETATITIEDVPDNIVMFVGMIE